MIKYIALLKVDNPEYWSQWHSSPTYMLYKSPISNDKKEVEKWLDDQLKNYPDARINISRADREYIIKKTLIAFDDEESEDVEYFIKNLIPFDNKPL